MCLVNESSDRHKRGHQFVRIYLNKLDLVCLFIIWNPLHFSLCSGQVVEVVNHCPTSLFGTNDLLSDIVI